MFPLKCVYTGNSSATQMCTSFRHRIRHFDDNDIDGNIRYTLTGNKNRNIVFGSTMHGFLFAKSIQWRMCFVILCCVVAGSSQCVVVREKFFGVNKRYILFGHTRQQNTQTDNNKRVAKR